MIVITYQMKQAVYNHPMEFFLEFRPVFQGIFTYGIHTYEQVTGKNIALTIIESDDIRKIIVTERALCLKTKSVSSK